MRYHSDIFKLISTQRLVVDWCARWRVMTAFCVYGSIANIDILSARYALPVVFCNAPAGARVRLIARAPVWRRNARRCCDYSCWWWYSSRAGAVALPRAWRDNTSRSARVTAAWRDLAIDDIVDVSVSSLMYIRLATRAPCRADAARAARIHDALRYSSSITTLRPYSATRYSNACSVHSAPRAPAPRAACIYLWWWWWSILFNDVFDIAPGSGAPVVGIHGDDVHAITLRHARAHYI